jgi:BirA family biotin operon repressor/biotin-[acetyl-CoA-carboxylase] ligase
MKQRFHRDSALQAIDQLDYFQSIRWCEEVDSTNRCLARELKSDSPPSLPALLVADRQLAGVGRGQNSWWSPSGCLMFSMAMPWSTPEPERATFPLQVGLSIAQSLAEWSVDQPKVKWPNDVYIEDRKVCGILIESSTRRMDGYREEYSIIGIGINCCIDWSGAPDELRASAISLHEASPKNLVEAISPESILLSVLQHWRNVSDRSRMDKQWLERDWTHWSWLDGKWVEIVSGGFSQIGLAKGIDSSGALLIEDRFGRTHAILSGTVRAIEGDP